MGDIGIFNTGASEIDLVEETGTDDFARDLLNIFGGAGKNKMAMDMFFLHTAQNSANTI